MQINKCTRCEHSRRSHLATKHVSLELSHNTGSNCFERRRIVTIVCRSTWLHVNIVSESVLCDCCCVAVGMCDQLVWEEKIVSKLQMSSGGCSVLGCFDQLESKWMVVPEFRSYTLGSLWGFDLSFGAGILLECFYVAWGNCAYGFGVGAAATLVSERCFLRY
jgi:hypothetical protein